MIEKKEQIYSCSNCSYTQAFSLPITLKASIVYVPGPKVFPSTITRCWCFDCDRITDCFTGQFDEFVYSDLPSSLRSDLEKSLGTNTWVSDRSEFTFDKLKMKLQDEMISHSSSLFKFLKRKQRNKIKLLAKCIEELEAMNQRGNYEYQSKPKSPRCMECGNCNVKLEIPQGVPHICGGFLESRVIDPHIDGMTPRINGERFTKVLYDQSGMVIERFETYPGEGVHFGSLAFEEPTWKRWWTRSRKTI